MLTVLLSLLPLSLSIAVMFFFFDRVAKRARRDLIVYLIDVYGQAQNECIDLAKRRKGNNFGDQMFRADARGAAEAYRNASDVLRAM